MGIDYIALAVVAADIAALIVLVRTCRRIWRDTPRVEVKTSRFPGGAILIEPLTEDTMRQLRGDD